jgi:hypothetical protein
VEDTAAAAVVDMVEDTVAEWGVLLQPEDGAYPCGDQELPFRIVLYSHVLLSRRPAYGGGGGAATGGYGYGGGGSAYGGGGGAAPPAAPAYGGGYGGSGYGAPAYGGGGGSMGNSLGASLAHIDFSAQQLVPVEFNFYIEHPDVAKRSEQEAGKAGDLTIARRSPGFLTHIARFRC